MDKLITVGRILHYVSHGTPGGEYHSECRAALVTGLRDLGQVSVTVFTPSGFFMNEPHYADSNPLVGGTWHWPQECRGLPPDWRS